MSLLPERRKTPEELAALRESLGIPAEASNREEDDSEKSGSEVETASAGDGDPIPSAQAIERTPKEAPLPEAASSPESEEPLPPSETEDGEVVIRVGVDLPVRTLRKSAGLAVDKPKQQIARGDSGVIPSKRHSDDELNRIRKAAQLTPPAGDLVPKAAHVVSLVVLYGIGTVIVLAGLLGALARSVPITELPFEWLIRAVQRDSFPMVLFGILCAGAAAFLLAAGWLGWKRPLSRHHAGFMTIIAVLVLVFGTLYSFPQLHGA